MKISSGFILLLFFITFVVCEYSNGLTEKEMRGKGFYFILLLR